MPVRFGAEIQALPRHSVTPPATRRIKLKAQVIVDDAIAFGPGKADLLEAIDREGSISAAGRSLGMSYRRTWLLVDTMNRHWREPLVETVVGARAGARLSAAGRAVLADYRALDRALTKTATGTIASRLLARLK